jgi:Mitochondrial domain of unknown function (DUF1713)
MGLVPCTSLNPEFPYNVPAHASFHWAGRLGSVIKKRRKKMRKHKHKKMLKATRWQRRTK